MNDRLISEPAPRRLVSIVVPVYYNADTLSELLHRFRTIADALPHLGFEFLCVDDGSGDDSMAILTRESVADRRVRAIRLARNFGSNAAILAGLTHARGDCAVVIAADLQDPPELIPQLVRAWEDGSEVVLAARRTRHDPPLATLAATIFNRLFRRLVFPTFPRDGFDFMLVSARVAGILATMAEKNSYIFGQVMWVGFQPSIVYYDRLPRQFGSSRWSFTRRVKYFIDAFTAFSYWPIRVASLAGFIFALVGVLYALVIIALRLLNVIQEPGFAAIMVVLLLTSGVQLVVTGMIGEYLWRVLEEVRGRPVFIVAHTVNMDEGQMPIDVEDGALASVGLQRVTGGSTQY